MTGRDGRDSLVEVPVGTLVFEHLPEGDRLLADLDAPGKEFVAVQGGRGGKGNLHFKSSTMRAPRFAQPGEPWTEMDVRLELKILADAGIIGLPNAGKSTLISTLSAARPKIAPYPFTTLSPNLGVMENDYNVRMVLADIPGLIEGAHEGHGLGHRFLKHVERTRFLVHVCSIEDLGQDDPWSGFALVDEELARFDPVLARKPQIKAVNKIDLRSPADVDALKARARDDGIEVFFISALQGDGVDELAAAMWRSLAESAQEENPKVGNNV